MRSRRFFRTVAITAASVAVGALTTAPAAGVGPGDNPQQPPATALPAPISLAASFSDWWVPAATHQIVATASYINQPTGRYDHTGSVYYAAVPLQAGKAVEAVGLPVTGTSPNPGMHIFTMAVS
jgi:hypothetical protein